MIVSVALVAPLMRPLSVRGAPFLRQRKVSGPLPPAMTVKVAVAPSSATTFAGGCVRLGATPEAGMSP